MAWVAHTISPYGGDDYLVNLKVVQNAVILPWFSSFFQKCTRFFTVIFIQPYIWHQFWILKKKTWCCDHQHFSVHKALILIIICQYQNNVRTLNRMRNNGTWSNTALEIAILYNSLNNAQAAVEKFPHLEEVINLEKLDTSMFIVIQWSNYTAHVWNQISLRK